ncbi:Ulp1 peptidase [Trifolium repens]|nr:Ulp1 peptidase [Trifolium repens]
MTQAQKARIEATPFKWLMRLPKKLKIRGILLDELVKRWNEKRGGFLIEGRLIRFTPLDVCFALGLSIVGEKVDLIEDSESRTKELFDGMVISKDNICAKLDNLQRDEDVEDFCRLYILLGLEEFYFPNSSSNVQAWYFKYLDDLDSIGKYNWGLAVYETLALSLNEGGQKLSERKNSAQLHIRGCAVVLQVWALEHVLAVEDLSATKEELEDAAVREALYWVPTGYFKWNEDFVARTAIMNNTRLLIAENQDIEASISQLEVQLQEICQLRSPVDVSMEDVDFAVEREVTNLSHTCEDGEASNLYTRLKEKPRKRMESAVTRSPWATTYARKKKKTEEV